MFFQIFFYMIISCSLQALDDSHLELIKKETVPDILKERVTSTEWGKMDDVERIKHINDEVKLNQNIESSKFWSAFTGSAYMLVGPTPLAIVTLPALGWCVYNQSQLENEQIERKNNYQKRLQKEIEYYSELDKQISYQEELLYQKEYERHVQQERKQQEHKERWGNHEYQSIVTFDDITRTDLAERNKKKREELEKELRLKIFNENPDDIEKKGSWIVSLKKASFKGEEGITVFLPRLYNAPEHSISYDSDNDNKNGFSKYGYIRRRDFYQPHNYSPFTKHKVVVIVVHGTWGGATPDFYDDQNPTNLSYRHIKRYAASLGEKDQAEVILESFQWQGELDEVNRGNAAGCLKDHINEHYQNDKVFIITHSHGGNVVHQVTHELKKPVDTLVMFACPVRLNNYHNRPYRDGYENFIYFHSDPDMISLLGRQEDGKRSIDVIKAFTSVGAVIGVSQVIGNIINKNIPAPVVTGISTIGVGASVGPDLTKIIKQQSTFPVYPGKTMIGIHVLFNGRGVGHSSVDGNIMWTYEIMNVSKYLPELMEALKKNYSHCFGKAALLEADFHPDDPYNPFILSEDNKHRFPKFEAQ